MDKQKYDTWQADEPIKFRPKKFKHRIIFDSVLSWCGIFIVFSSMSNFSEKQFGIESIFFAVFGIGLWMYGGIRNYLGYIHEIEKETYIEQYKTRIVMQKLYQKIRGK